MEKKNVKRNKNIEEKYNHILLNAYQFDKTLGEKSIVDIAILGSHNSFTKFINSKSKYNIHEDIPLKNKFAQKIFGKIVSNYSKTQTLDAYEQANLGVRYFDVRLTYLDGKFYTCHGLINREIDADFKDLIRFLYENPGEYLLIHLQHFYSNDKNAWNKFAEKLQTIKYKGKTIYDFIDLNVNKCDPNKVTYNIFTDNGKKAATMFLVEGNPVTNKFAEYFVHKDIFNKWANKAKTKEIIKAISYNEEYLLKNNVKGFRINQAILTANFDEPIATIGFGSLVHIAKSHNNKLLKNIDFQKSLVAMPIFMVDNISSKNHFNQKVNQEIYKFNTCINFQYYQPVNIFEDEKISNIVRQVIKTTNENKQQEKAQEKTLEKI